MVALIRIPLTRPYAVVVMAVMIVLGGSLAALRTPADIRLANAQITAVSQTLPRQLPTGTTPPLILNYNASTVPALQIAPGG